MGHLIPMAFNSIIIILIGHAHPWALMGKNVTVIVARCLNEKVKRDRNCFRLAHPLGIDAKERDRNCEK